MSHEPQPDPAPRILSRSIVSVWTLSGVLVAAGAGPIGIAAAQEAPARAPLPPGQVWQCIRDGHKTFSDAPCGAGATIRQLNDVNVMDPEPATAWHGPAYPPPRVAYAPYPASYRGDQQPPGIADAADAANAADPVYATQQVGIVNQSQVRRSARPLRHEHPSAHVHVGPAGHAARR